MIYDKADEVTEELFESLLKRYRIGLETTMEGSDIKNLHLLYYKCSKTNLNRGGSYIDIS